MEFRLLFFNMYLISTRKHVAADYIKFYSNFTCWQGYYTTSLDSHYGCLTKLMFQVKLTFRVRFTEAEHRDSFRESNSKRLFSCSVFISYCTFTFVSLYWDTIGFVTPLLPQNKHVAINRVINSVCRRHEV